MIINAKIVGILTFMTMIEFMISPVGHGKCFMTSGPERHEEVQVKSDRQDTTILDKSLKY